MFGEYSSLIYAAIAVVAVCIGGATSSLAVEKGHSAQYFWLGLFFGIFGFVYVAGLPLSKALRERDIEIAISKYIKKQSQDKQS